jgi:hypothetical protein
MDGMQSPPQHELPQPQVSQGEVGASFDKEGFGHVTPELKVAPMPGEKIAQSPAAISQAVSAIPTIPIQIQLPSDPAAQTSTGVIADDTDVIEKEWVDKAKEIVTRTQGDPHAKSNELTGLKKEYIQKRYGKTIITPSDEAAKE